MPDERRITYSAESLLREFRVYDESVDIVSAYEWLFTEVPDMAETVVHFERFPRLVLSDGRKASPDFTVVFDDGSAVVGEIARLPLAEQGVDKLCAQILRYDTIESLPCDSDGALMSVAPVDVLLLTPIASGLDAVERILRQRLADPSHSYNPSRAPILTQFVKSSERYTFQRVPDDLNGVPFVGNRSPNLNERRSLNIAPDRFAHVKVARAFVNDPIPPLYLASVLWMKVWPTLVGAVKSTFEVTVQGTLVALREQYASVRASDVKAALELLRAAGLARQKTEPGLWTIVRAFSARGEQDFGLQVATRAETDLGAKRQRPRPRPRPRIAQGQEPLF